jgi:hypothetical protein
MRAREFLIEDRPVIINAGSYSVSITHHVLERAEERQVSLRNLLLSMHKLDSIDPQIENSGLEMGQGFWLQDETNRISLLFKIRNLPAHQVKLITVVQGRAVAASSVPIFKTV